MIKSKVNGLFSTPVGFLRELVGKRRIIVQEDKNIYKLGKQCQQCHKPIIHRDSISICQCYCFAHKNCLKKQLTQQLMSECTNIQCRQCKCIIGVVVDLDYSYQLRWSWRDIVLLTVCLVVCCLGIVFLTGLKSVENQQQFTQNQLNSNAQQQIQTHPFLQILTITIIFVFGMLFWLTLMAILFRRQINIHDILSTNIEIKVSAFLEIETKIREQTQQEIPVKRQRNQV